MGCRLLLTLLLASVSVGAHDAFASMGGCVAQTVPSTILIGRPAAIVEAEVQGAAGCSWRVESSSDWITPLLQSGVTGDLIRLSCQGLPVGETSRVGEVVLTGGGILRIEQTAQGPERTQSLQMYGDVAFDSRENLRLFRDVALGDRFTLCISNNPDATVADVGRVVAFGRSGNNQCVAPTGINAARVSAGAEHGMALTDENGLGTVGRVICWGSNAFDQCTPPSGLGLCTAIDAGRSFSMALTQQGSVVCWGGPPPSQPSYRLSPTPNFGSRFVHAIAAGGRHAMALLSESPDELINGTVEVWGDNSKRQWPSAAVRAKLVDIKAIAAGENHCLALTSAGEVVAWGDNGMGQCNVPPIVADRIDADGNWSIAVLKAPTTQEIVRSWGEAPSGFSPLQTAILHAQGIAKISAGVNHLAALTNDGTLVLAGSNQYLQLNTQLTIDRVAGVAAGSFAFAAWNDIGRFEVFCTTSDAGAYGVCAGIPVGLERVSTMALGRNHAIAVDRTTRLAVCWGDNQFQKCVVPPDLGPVELVAAGTDHSAALQAGADGTIRCWGSNFQGQLTVPPLGGRPVKLAASGFNTLTIVQHAASSPPRASVRGWGVWGVIGGPLGSVTVPPDLTSQTGPMAPIEVAAGLYQSVVLRANGEVSVWGLASSPAVTANTRGLDARAISSGLQHVSVLEDNDRVKAFGNDDQSQVSGPKSLQQVLALACGENRTLVVIDTALPLPNDIDGDGCTNGSDLGIILAAWGTDGLIPNTDPQQNADLNGDGVVNGADLGLLLEDWYSNPFCGR